MSYLKKYLVLQETAVHPDLGPYRTYGIAVGDEMYMDYIHDISTYKDRVEYIVEMFNRNGLAPVHFREAVEDWLDSLI